MLESETQRFAFRNAIARLIETCKNTTELKQIHAQIIASPKLAKRDHEFLISRLLYFSAISIPRFLSYAISVFQRIQSPDLGIYNIMIRAYATKRERDCDTLSCPALKLFKQMLSNGIAPDSLTIPFLVKECTRRFDVGSGRCLHGLGIKSGHCGDIFVQNSLTSFYSTCGWVDSARNLFDEMCDRDVVSWNSMITGYLKGGNLDEALRLFRSMKNKNAISWNSIITGFVHGCRTKDAFDLFREMLCLSEDDNNMVKPDKITIATVLSACAHVGAFDQGKWVHSFLTRTGMECDMVIGTALVDMYGKCGYLRQALDVFEEMPEKDTLAWTAMISVLALHGHCKKAFEAFEKMEAEGVKPNHITFVGLLSACAHSGSVERGRQCFELMTKAYLIEPQVHHYACMVDILSRAGLLQEAEKLVRGMPLKPDVFVWGALLGGCQIHGDVKLGERAAKCLIDLEPLNHAFYVNLCDIYAKAGRFEDVKRVRALMKEKEIRKEVAGCSLIEVDGTVHEFSVTGSAEIVTKQIAWILNALNGEIKLKDDMNWVQYYILEIQ
ncbi:hypothetical protein K2173_008515 [Erythroxylum novogranatense]|uniref:Uncharacterized protein n=1 Tax=Erythroxylum novogranatense TaxID=1862640 RepID=A0AAV8SL52_9ROSI|nr:hypothetical protein K2173_008515 [Erythroxylum novogranatense]